MGQFEASAAHRRPQFNQANVPSTALAGKATDRKRRGDFAMLAIAGDPDVLGTGKPDYPMEVEAGAVVTSDGTWIEADVQVELTAPSEIEDGYDAANKVAPSIETLPTIHSGPTFSSAGESSASEVATTSMVGQGVAKRALEPIYEAAIEQRYDPAAISPSTGITSKRSSTITQGSSSVPGESSLEHHDFQNEVNNAGARLAKRFSQQSASSGAGDSCKTPARSIASDDSVMSTDWVFVADADTECEPGVERVIHGSGTWTPEDIPLDHDIDADLE